MKRKIIFGVEEGIVGISFLVWIILTTAFFGPQMISGFHANLTPETDSTKKISDIVALSTVAELGSVLIFISSGLLIVYFGCLAAMVFFKIRKRIIFYSNIVCFIIIAIAMVLGILFLTLNL